MRVSEHLVQSSFVVVLRHFAGTYDRIYYNTSDWIIAQQYHLV